MSEKTKVIFLDVDGVINRNAPGEFGEVTYAGCLKVLKEIIFRTEAKVILSSGWKRFFDDDMTPINKLGQQLSEDLGKYDIKLFGRTNDFSTEQIVKDKAFDKCKPDEIHDYVSSHKILRYVVLDDLPLKGLDGHLYRTDHTTGLVESDIEKIVEILKVEL